MSKKIKKQKVLASFFDDPKGNHNNSLDDGGYYYSELSKDPKKKDFKALGGLKNGHKLKITYKNKTLIASKGDVGAGGPKLPKIDLHIKLAKDLNFDFKKGVDEVEIEDAEDE